jgi:hypothetical protein
MATKPQAKARAPRLQIEIVGTGVPKGVTCCVCGYAAGKGDVVAWRRGSGKVLPTLLHKECMEQLLEAMPATSGKVRESVRQYAQRALQRVQEDIEEYSNASPGDG